MASNRLRIDGKRFRDRENREVTFRGINVAGEAKFPAIPDQPSHVSDNFWDGDNVSFVGRPFSKADAHTHFDRLKQWGYNTIRYIFTWEAIEHAGPGKYDDEWIDYTLDMLRIAKEYGFYILMDPHQDVWSRFSGGSGAPMWTLYAAGLDPEAFLATQGAFVHNTYPDPANYPKMIWSTNYTRAVCQTMFTLFFGGKDFAPNAIIDGKNIQDYLQDHYIAACKHFAQCIHDAGYLENEVVIGWESLNEPNRGLISWPDLSVIPSEQKLQKGPSPTAWQALLIAAGRAEEVDTWGFGSFGPYKTGKELVDPQGQTIWLSESRSRDSTYGWKRDPGWKLGECLWAQQGVWDPSQDKLLDKYFFAKHPKTGEKLDYEQFTNIYFMNHYRKYRDAIRSVHTDAFMFCQAPVLEIPPDLKGTEDDDPLMVYATHYYDGLTLLTKHWNKLYNVDVFGVMRGKYLAPVFAIKIGETAIRNCLRDQLEAIRKEGMQYLGKHPCVFTEIGVPYDMDDKHAYKTGDYSSQSLAMDANHFALEGSGAAGYTLWTYVAENNHEWGDLWNGEDLSIFSVDDHPLPPPPTPSDLPQNPNESTISLDRGSPSYSQSRSSTTNLAANPANISATLKTPSISSNPSPSQKSAELSSNSGFRAAEAFVRPAPIVTNGSVTKYGFDLRSCTFTFSLTAEKATGETAPTEVFLPEYHFPRTGTNVEVTGGRWTIDIENVGDGNRQLLRWWHAAGEQSLTVKGVKRKIGGGAINSDEDEGYLAQCQKAACAVM